MHHCYQRSLPIASYTVFCIICRRQGGGFWKSGQQGTLTTYAEEVLAKKKNKNVSSRDNITWNFFVKQTVVHLFPTFQFDQSLFLGGLFLF